MCANGQGDGLGGFGLGFPLAFFLGTLYHERALKAA